MTLSEWMASNDLTDQEVADLVGIDRSNINRLRRGVTRPSWELVSRIKAASKGRVTADDFLERAP